MKSLEFGLDGKRSIARAIGAVVNGMRGQPDAMTGREERGERNAMFASIGR